MHVPAQRVLLNGDPFPPLVTLTALQSSFDPDSSSSSYVVRSTPLVTERGTCRTVPGARPMRRYTSIDVRLTVADMFAKLRAAAA